MDTRHITFAMYGAGAAVLAAALLRLKARLELSRAKHPSLTGHARMSRRVAALVPFYEFDRHQVFRSDGAPDDVARRREAGFMRLSSLFRERFSQTSRLTAEAQAGISDLQFVNSYRVPFQYSRFVREHLRSGSFLQSSSGVMLTDLDGNRFYDVAGSYGVNLFGYDFYRACMEAGYRRVRDLGPVLGAYHPAVAYNVKRLKQISGLDEVSFHMSGTEAVMQAVRLARYHTGKRRLVRFCGAYHGWWGDVQPGVGNPLPARDTYTLSEMSERTLHVLRTRRDIACVLVNPLQALHPNMGPPADSALVDSSRAAHFDKAAYTDWLKRLRAVCSERGIVLIIDDVFLGFRVAPGRVAGVLRRQGRHGDLRQVARRRPAGRRRVRARRSHEALARRPAGEHHAGARHVQRASERHGRDAGVPGAARHAADPGAVREPGCGAERARGAAQHSAWRRKTCRCAWRTCRRSGR